MEYYHLEFMRFIGNPVYGVPSGIAFVYFSFRGACASLYDLTGWILEKWPPSDRRDED